MSRHIVTMSIRTDDVARATHLIDVALDRADLPADSIRFAEVAPGEYAVALNVSAGEKGRRTLASTVRKSLEAVGLEADAVAVADIRLAPPSAITDAVAEAVRSVITSEGLEEYVTKRFPDEIEDYRNGDPTRSFAMRRRDQWTMRTDLAARAAVAALVEAGVLRVD